MSDLLLVFAKRPRPGEVKTRLVPALGEEAAAALYRALAEAEVRATAPAGGEYARVLCHSPADAGAEIGEWFPGQELMPQSEGDLGERMAAAFAEAFRRGVRRAAIVGSDVPWVSRETVREAFRSLEDHDLVLGPARDGGYYLIALGRPQPGLFRGIPWSTPSVLSATVDRAGALGLGVCLLDSLPDIDTIEDVKREWDRLAALLDPSLRATVAAALGL